MGGHPLRPRRRRFASVLGLALLGLRTPAAAATPGEVAVGQELRDALMQGLNGPPRRLSAYRGRPLVINVWASWCAPCRTEMASLERLAWGEWSDRFAVIGISTDDHVERALAWLQRSRATISHYIDRQLELEHMLGASHLPLTVLVDAQGRVLEKVAGAREWDGPEALRLIARHWPAKPAARGPRTAAP